MVGWAEVRHLLWSGTVEVWVWEELWVSMVVRPVAEVSSLSLLSKRALRV